MNVSFKNYATVSYQKAGFVSATRAKNAISSQPGMENISFDCYHDPLEHKLIVNHNNPNTFNYSILPVIQNVAGDDNVNYNPKDVITGYVEQMNISNGSWEKI